MAKCQKCGAPIIFRRLTEGKGKGKLCPFNPDGSEHWDDCSENQHTGKYGAQYKRFKALYRGPDPTGRSRAVEELTVTKRTKGDEPFWDESDGGLPWE